MLKNNDILRGHAMFFPAVPGGGGTLTSRHAISAQTVAGAEEITVAALSEKLAYLHHPMVRPEMADVSAPVGVGRYDIEKLRPGVSLTHFDVRYTRSMNIRADYQPGIFVGMLIKGRHDSIIGGQHFTFERPFTPTLFSVGLHAEACSIQREGEHCEIIGLNIEPEFLDLHADQDGAFARLSDMLAHPIIHREFAGGELMRCLLASMAQSPYGGVMARLHLESQALALIVELGRQMESEFNGRPSLVLRNRQERAEQSRLLIEENLAAPYSIAEIARRVGSNETTLRLDFKALFGKTIFEYLRDRRLDIGRLLVQQKALSIAEIAYRCGYSSPANFTTAYRRRFGAPPSQD
jgi:AraC-like DNA-binding protein